MREPRRFRLLRDHDVTGISGRGVVADGVLWPDGSCTIRWRGERASWVNWARLDDARAIHGHGGHTRFLFLDDDDPLTREQDPTVTATATDTAPITPTEGIVHDIEPGDITPQPDTDDGDASIHVSVSVCEPDDTVRTASVSLPADATDMRVADAIIDCALSVASLRGPAVHAAARHRVWT
jgi:hypothetical protein